MNYCRTCKHWGVKVNALGMGHCFNSETSQHVLWPEGFMLTTQNFGCVLYENGFCSTIVHEPEQECREIKAFLADRHMLKDVIQP